ncbi:BrnT family toxin [soil metagenome]
MQLEDFEWDETKANSNLIKHGISFIGATEVFEDEFRYTRDMTRPEYGEERFKAVGMLGSELAAVIYTMRGTKFRIISARNASEKERRQYRERSTAS